MDRQYSTVKAETQHCSRFLRYAMLSCFPMPIERHRTVLQSLVDNSFTSEIYQSKIRFKHTSKLKKTDKQCMGVRRRFLDRCRHNSIRQCAPPFRRTELTLADRA